MNAVGELAKITAPAVGGTNDRRVISGSPIGVERPGSPGGVERQCRFRCYYPLPKAGLSPSEIVMSRDYNAPVSETYRHEQTYYLGFDKNRLEKPMHWDWWIHESLTNDQAYVQIMEGYVRRSEPT